MKHTDEAIRQACLGRRVRLPDGIEVPQLGMGTWRMGERPNLQTQETKALRSGLNLGMRLIDTAEMYGSGASEELIQIALAGIPRQDFFLVSKVYPYNASKEKIFSACETSLKRLGQDYLDLYLLHWRGSVPLSETVEQMEEMVQRGWIRRWGVSNFDVDDMEELWNVPMGDRCAVNQVLYHLASRGIEFSLLPWMKEHGVAAMAYSPLAQAGQLSRGLLESKALEEVAKQHDATPSQILLAFAMHNPGVIVIPKASSTAHVQSNAEATLLHLTDADIETLSAVFPPPRSKQYLDIV